jgi:hypothetical protein
MRQVSNRFKRQLSSPYRIYHNRAHQAQTAKGGVKTPEEQACAVVTFAEWL